MISWYKKRQYKKVRAEINRMLSVIDNDKRNNTLLMTDIYQILLGHLIAVGCKRKYIDIELNKYYSDMITSTKMNINKLLKDMDNETTQ